MIDEISNFPMRGEFLINEEPKVIWEIYKTKKAEYHLFIYSEIYEPFRYTEVFNFLGTLNQNDTLYIHINSQGGDFSCLLAFESALSKTKAWTISLVDGEADSSAFCLVFMCKEVHISKFSTLFTHNIIIDTSGKDVSSVSKFLKFSGNLYEKLLKTYCSCVLSDEEISQVCKESKELYFYGPEILERLKKTKKAKGDGFIL